MLDAILTALVMDISFGGGLPRELLAVEEECQLPALDIRAIHGPEEVFDELNSPSVNLMVELGNGDFSKMISYRAGDWLMIQIQFV